ncbi:MAG: acyl carrier protein [candidate division Zixibacteria bacterium]|nr:acyl carrier protein [candidate division Zixibacteria bacterium]
MDIRSELREFIVDNFMMGMNPNELTDSGSFLGLGIIDSTGVLELIEFLEEKYSIQVDDSDLVPNNLDSVDNLIKYIQRKTS